MPIIRFIVFGIAKTLSKVFGLATMSFFGRLPSRDDAKIATVGLLSLTWLAVFVAIFVPDLAEMLIPFAPDDETVLRWLAVAHVLVLPAINGALISRMHNHRGGHGRSTGAILLHAYWYTALIGVVTTAVIVLVPILKASYLAKRFSVARLLIVIPADQYDRVLDHLVGTLRRRGLEAEVQPPDRILRTGFRWLSYVLGHIFVRDVATELQTIQGRDADDAWFEVIVHAADLTIVGRQKPTARVQAVLAEGLDERLVYFTWDDESQAVEDRMRAQRERLSAGDPVDLDEVRQLGEDLAALQLDLEEWNNVRRNLYRLERDVYAERAGLRSPEQETQRVQERGEPV